VDIETKQKELQRDIEKCEEQLKEIEMLSHEFPDIQVSRDRWDHEFYTAKSANVSVTSAWFNHNCGCCADSPLQMWPYLEVNGTRIHSDPMKFMIGEKCPNCSRDIADPGWERDLQKSGIPDAVIEVGRDYFSENSCSGSCYDEDDDEDDY
jgi:hypothetical protein